jgi:hypothetical protein
MSTWIDPFAAKLPPELVEWARTQPDLATAWTSCERVDWLIDLGATLPLDETSQRALVSAAANLDLDDPTFLRLTPCRRRIAEVWAHRSGAGAFDILGTMRYEDIKNGIVVALPLAITAMLLLQYDVHVSRTTLGALRFASFAALPGAGIVWGFLRRRLSARALRNYRYERAAHDVFAPTRRMWRRMAPRFSSLMLKRFREGWTRVADFPTPRLSAS